MRKFLPKTSQYSWNSFFKKSKSPLFNVLTNESEQFDRNQNKSRNRNHPYGIGNFSSFVSSKL